MNKTNVSILEYPQLRMDSVGYVRLGKFWNSVILGGHYWRLYYNDDYGAGVYVGRRKGELKSICCLPTATLKHGARESRFSFICILK